MMSNSEESNLKEYVGYIWIEEQPGVLLSILAGSPEEARRLLEAEHGTGHVISLWNEEDARRPR